MDQLLRPPQPQNEEDRWLLLSGPVLRSPIQGGERKKKRGKSRRDSSCGRRRCAARARLGRDYVLTVMHMRAHAMEKVTVSAAQRGITGISFIVLANAIMTTYN